MDGYGGGEKGALASELAQVLSMVRELEARMDQDPLPPAARELCTELASSVDRSIRIARSCAAGDGNAGAAKDAQPKRRKGAPCVRRQLRAASVQDVAPLDDGLSWRKYGQKDILGAKYPRYGMQEGKAPPARSTSPWDCGSPLYDAAELASVYRVLDTHLMALPRSGRGRGADADNDDDAAVAVAVAAAKRASGRTRRRRRAAARTGKALLHSICRSIACGRRL